jgi:AcrR family transcriptional regulator
MVSIVIDTMRAARYDAGVEPADVDGRHARQIANRAAVARAALDLVQETGELPSAEAVAERAGVSRRSVFRLFDDREALLRSVVKLMQRQVLDRFPPPAPHDGPGQVWTHHLDELRRLVAHRASIYEEVRPVCRLAEQLKTRDPLVREHMAHSRELDRSHLAAFLSRFFEQAAPDGQPPDDRAGDAVDGAGSADSSRHAVLDAVQLVISWNSWDYLRFDLGQSREEAEASVVRTLAAILGAG